MTYEHKHCYCIKITRAGRAHLQCCGCSNVILDDRLTWGGAY